MSDTWQYRIWFGVTHKRGLTPEDPPTQVWVEVSVDRTKLEGFARKAANNKNGRAKIGPFVARTLKRDISEELSS